MVKMAAAWLAFLGGFAVMVLEIVGARFLAKDFGSSFYVWISQIGVVLMALALGYAVGGPLADRWRRTGPLTLPLLVAGSVTVLIPNFTPPLIAAIVHRHPLDEPIPILWQKLDPVLGSTLIFFLPCFVLAILSPYLTRMASGRLEKVGTISGLVYAAGTMGSIVGVFLSGYVLMDHLNLTAIFRATGGLIVLLGINCLALERWMMAERSNKRGGEPGRRDLLQPDQESLP